MSYAYRPVKDGEFRVLEISPSTPGSELRGKLHHVHMENVGVYSALSYCWGDASKTKSIWIDGRELAITASVFSAIEAKRKPDCDQRIWIDQVCINQKDISEKNSQVQNLMGPIYSKTAELLIWLGESDESSELAFDAIERGCDEIARHGTCTYYKADFSVVNIRTPTGVLDLEPWIAVQRLVARPWFSRAWASSLSPRRLYITNENKITQEVCLPYTDSIQVLCGSQRMPWWKLACIRNAMARYGWYLHVQEASTKVREILSAMTAQKPETFPEQYRQVFKDNTSKARISNLLTNLWTSRNQSCGDPRDKVYSIKHLSKDHAAESVSVDYDVDVTELFTSTARSIIQSTKSLRVLGACQLTKNHPKLPSWVPDWTVGSAYRPSTTLTVMLKWEETGSNQMIPELQADIPRASLPNVLVLYGYRLETVSVVSSDRSDRWKRMLNLDQGENLDRGELIDFLFEAVRIAIINPIQDGGHNKTLPVELSAETRALCITLFAASGAVYLKELAHNITEPGEEQDTAAPIAEPEAYEKLKHYIGQAHARTDIETLIVNSNTLGRAMLAALLPDIELRDAELPALWTTLVLGRDVKGEPWRISSSPRANFLPYWSALTAALFARKFFKTENRDMGLGPYETTQGDIVCMFPGATVPFIMRPNPGAGQWTLIGECYCYSYMDGLKGRDILGDKSRLEEFHIV